MKKRYTNLDLLKIICIFMILVLHYLNPNFGAGGGILLFSRVTSLFLKSLSIVAVDVFIVITGYFMIKRNSINVRKIIDIIFIMVFYAIFIYLFVLIFSIKKVNPRNLYIFFKMAFSRWFIDIYIILYIFSPYLNKLACSLSKKRYFTLLIICIFFFYIWPTFFTDSTISDRGYGIVNFVILYLLGGYIKIFKDEYKCKEIIFLYFISSILTALFGSFVSRAWNYNSIFNLISALSLFLFFKSINLKENKIINYFSSFALSTYIIHENEFICKGIYQGIFKTLKYRDTLLLIPHIFITCICIFLGCIIIEVIRRKLFNSIVNNIFNNIKFCNKKIIIE